MADPTTMKRRMPVGYRFCPTEEQLVAYYLPHKLMSHDPPNGKTIPEFDVCNYEPWELRALAASAFPETEQDDSECYFFSRCDYKYSNSTRFKRTTSLGYWKVTGKDRPIRDRGTNKVIGTKKLLVFYERCTSHEIRHNWVIHEYHDAIFPPGQRTYVLCKLMKKYEKKTKEKTIDFEYESIGHKRKSNNYTDFENENPANFSILSKEYYLSNMNSTVQTSSYPEVMDSVIHTPFQPNEVINSTTQTSLQPSEGYLSNEDIDSMIQVFDQSTVQTSSHPEVMDSLVHTPFQLNEVINSMTQTSLQPNGGYLSNEDTDSIIQAFYQSNGVLPPELLKSIMDTPLDFGYDDEFYHG